MTTLVPKYDLAVTSSVNRPFNQKLAETVSVKDFGAKGDGTTNDTTSIQNAINYVFANGGGTVYFPEGNYLISTISNNFTSATTVNLVGAGMNATTLTKTGGLTTPIIDFRAPTSILVIYSTISNLSIVGDFVGAGIELTNCANFSIDKCYIKNCAVAIENLGSLIFSINNSVLQSNIIGYRSRIANTISCNLISLNSCQFIGNDQHGLDIGNSAGLTLNSVDIELNGTSGAATTTGMIIRDTCGAETGFSNIVLNTCWFETQRGANFLVENATAVTLALNDCNVYNANSNALTVGVIKVINLTNVVIAGTATLAAGASVISTSTINILADTSGSRQYSRVTTTSGTTDFQLSTAYDVIIANGGIKSAKDVISVPTATATTLFSLPTIVGMYLVFCYLPSSGATYMANARIGFDGANAVRMGGEDGASMAITVSGINVQATQTSGATQNVNVIYQLIG